MFQSLFLKIKKPQVRKVGFKDGFQVTWNFSLMVSTFRLKWDAKKKKLRFPGARNGEKRLSVQNWNVTIPSKHLNIIILGEFRPFVVLAKTWFMQSNPEWYSYAEWYSDTGHQTQLDWMWTLISFEPFKAKRAFHVTSLFWILFESYLNSQINGKKNHMRHNLYQESKEVTGATVGLPHPS